MTDMCEVFIKFYFIVKRSDVFR